MLGMIAVGGDERGGTLAAGEGVGLHGEEALPDERQEEHAPREPHEEGRGASSPADGGEGSPALAVLRHALVGSLLAIPMETNKKKMTMKRKMVVTSSLHFEPNPKLNQVLFWWWWGG